MKKLIIAAAISLASFGVNAKSCVEVVTNAYNHTINDYDGDPAVVKSLSAMNLYMQTCQQAKKMSADGVDKDYWLEKIKEVNKKYVLKGVLPADVYYTNVVIADIAYE